MAAKLTTKYADNASMVRPTPIFVSPYVFTACVNARLCQCAIVRNCRVFTPSAHALLARLHELCNLIVLDKSSCPAPLMPPDSAYLNSFNPLLRNPSRLPGQFSLPRFPAQEDAYVINSRQTHPQDTLALPQFNATMDPSRLLQRQISIPTIQAESASESDVDMDDGGESDHGLDFQPEDDDAAGWGKHPDTIRLGTPDFHQTEIKGDMRDAAGVQVPVVIHARFVLKKKAARQQNFWILYRRNYFGVQGSYNLDPLPDSSPDETLYLYRDNHKPEPIRALLMCMRGVVESEEGPEIKIVVFNAKRKPLHEGKEPPPIEPQRMKPLTEGSSKYYAASTGDRQDHLNVPMNHTFHRNQFRAATQNNGARRTEQQFYHILLELKAEVDIDGAPKSFTVASKMSEALVVRGRCPLSFKDKDGHTRGPDRKGRKSPRDGGSCGNRKGSTMQSLKEGQAKGASRASCNKTSGGSRRSTRGSSNITGTRSTNTDFMSPLPTYHANGTVDRETLPRLDRDLLILTREPKGEHPQWLCGHDDVLSGR